MKNPNLIIFNEQLNKVAADLIQLALRYNTLAKNAKTQTKRNFYQKKLSSVKTQLSQLLVFQQNLTKL